MKTRKLYFILLTIFSMVACAPKPPTEPKKKPVYTDNDSDPSITEKLDKVEKKGTPPPLPGWAKMPLKKTDAPAVTSKVNTISLEVADGIRIKVKKPYKIFQIGDLKSKGESVVMPVRVEHGKYWIRGTLDMFQVEIKLGSGINLYDAPKGAIVGFVSAPTSVEIKKINGNWIYIAQVFNEKCSPLYLKTWIKKSDLMKTDKKPVKFPWRFTKKLPKRQLNRNAPISEIYGRRKGDNLIMELPLCNDSDQIILVKKIIRSSKGRTKVFFKPSKNASVAVIGWIAKDVAQGNSKGTCSCRTNMPTTKTYGTAVIDKDYKTRTPLPLYLEPNEKTKPIGQILPSDVVKVDQYYKNGKFATVELEPGVTLYTPYHENYFYP